MKKSPDSIEDKEVRSVSQSGNRIRFFAKSTDRWKQRVRALEADLAKLEAQVRARDNEIEA